MKRLGNGQGKSETILTSILDQFGTYSLALLLVLSVPMVGCGVSTVGGAAGSSSGTGSGGSTPTATLAIIGPQQVRLQGSAKYTVQTSQLATSNVVWSLRTASGNANDVLGSIAKDGTYTAPPLPNTPVLVTLMATSVDVPTLSSTIQVELLNPVPTINAASFEIEPTSANYQISISGQGFAPGAVVAVNGAPLTPTGLSSNSILVSVPVSQLPQGTQAGAMATIVVDNPSPGSASSTGYDVLITGPSTSVVAATRLLDQMTFGPTVDSIAHVQSIGLPTAIDEQLKVAPEQMPQVSWWYNDLSPHCMPFTQCVVDGYWAQYAVFGQDQLKQRVAFALSKIWNASYFSVPVSEFSYFLNVLAKDSTTNYRTLMEDVTLTEAMGTYLNMINSAAPQLGEHAGENYARELMQLFTLGPDQLNDDGSLVLDSRGQPIPTYTQNQVQALGKAFTGWTYANNDCSTPAQFQIIYEGSIPGLGCPMVPVASMHDYSEKTIVDNVVLPPGQTPQKDLDQALDAIFNNSNMPPYMSRLLIQNLVTSAPSPAYIKRIAQVFANDGTGVRGNLSAVVKAVLLDAEARQGDDPTQPTMGGHLRDPILWTFAALRALDITQIGDESALKQLTDLEGTMQEQPHSQTSVFGFYSPDFTIPTTTINAPEFQMETPVLYSNMNLALDGYFLKPYFSPANLGDHVALDISAGSRLGRLAAQGVDPLLNGINTLFFHARMTQAERQVLQSALSGTTDPTDMMKVALYDTLISPQFRVIQ